MKTKTLLFFWLTAAYVILLWSSCNQSTASENNTDATTQPVWHAPDSSTLVTNPDAELIRYGEKLVANTSYYLGPNGIVSHISNRMNCQNCHMQAGTKPFGNNFGAVAATYPRFRPRSGKIENIFKKVNDCIQRSLNGKAIDTNSREMLAITAYIKWVGKDVTRQNIPDGAGGAQIAFLDRAADSVKGKEIYLLKCGACHGVNGGGMPNAPGIGKPGPALWGDNSYTTGAGIYRLGKLAAFIKQNMPFGTIYKSPVLTDEEAWDVAAYINSQPRPWFDASADWPDIKTKPIDYPFGPYADSFTETQHKYGPFKPMKKS
ncbi:MAG: c-type cytochrome [Bacteroidia bacterium]